MSEEITHTLVRTIVDAAIKKSQDIDVQQNIAVMDAGGNLKAFERMDGAWLGSIDIAMKKARTARLFNMETKKLGKMSQPGEPLYGVEISNGGLISFAGGIPLKNAAGKIIGAIGVSGGTVDQDEKVAEAGAEVCRQSK